QARQETLRYDSPAVNGFIFSASMAESTGSLAANTNWVVMLRYAGEHHGFRIAAGIGMEHYGDTYIPPSQSAGGVNQPCINLNGNNCASPGVATFSHTPPDINAWGAALSAMHVSSGLFLQGSVQGVQYNNDTSHTTGNWGESCAASTAAGNVIGFPSAVQGLDSTC